MRTGIKLGNKKLNIGVFSWKVLVIVVEFFFVFAAMAANYRLMILFMVIAFLAAALGTRRLSIIGDGFIAALILFLAYFSVRAVITNNYVDLFFYWMNAGILLFSTTFSDRPDASILNLLKWLGVFFGIGVILQAIFTNQFMSHYYPLFGEDYKVTIRRQVVFHQMYPGWTSQTFATSVNIIVGLFASWIIWKDSHKKREFVYMFVMLVGLILTGKRGPVLFAVMAFIIGESMISNNLRQIFNRFGKYFIVIALAVVALFLYFMSNQTGNRNVIIRFIEAFNSTDDVSNGRFVLWAYALRLVTENPVWGVGWGNYSALTEKSMGTAIEAHNVFLQLIVEVGIIGLVLFLIPTIVALVETVRYCRYARNVGWMTEVKLLNFSLVVQLFLILYSFTGNTIYDYNVLTLWMLAWSIYITIKNKLKANRGEG